MKDDSCYYSGPYRNCDADSVLRTRVYVLWTTGALGRLHLGEYG